MIVVILRFYRARNKSGFGLIKKDEPSRCRASGSFRTSRAVRLYAVRDIDAAGDIASVSGRQLREIGRYYTFGGTIRTQIENVSLPHEHISPPSSGRLPPGTPVPPRRCNCYCHFMQLRSSFDGSREPRRAVRSGCILHFSPVIARCNGSRPHLVIKRT